MTEKPWRWPGQWLRQESFWREVGSRTLSAVIAAGIIYLFALTTGYVGKPDILPLVITGLLVALALTALLTAPHWSGMRSKWTVIPLAALLGSLFGTVASALGFSLSTGLVVAIVVGAMTALVVTRFVDSRRIERKPRNQKADSAQTPPENPERRDAS